MKVYIRMGWDCVHHYVEAVYASRKLAEAESHGDRIEEHEVQGDADPVALLRRLVEANRIEERGVMECRCCGTVGCIGLQDGRRVAPHQPGCPWVAAEAFLAGLDGAEADR